MSVLLPSPSKSRSPVIAPPAAAHHESLQSNVAEPANSIPHQTPNSTASLIAPHQPQTEQTRKENVHETVHYISHNSIELQPYMAQSVHDPVISRDDHMSGKYEGYHPTIRGFTPSAPSYEESASQSLLGNVGLSDAEEHQLRSEPVYVVPAYPINAHPTANQPVQIMRHPQQASFTQHHSPQLHPVTVAAKNDLAAAAAAQERLAYLRSKALLAESKESESSSRHAPLSITEVRHLVEPNDDLVELAVRYGTTEANIKSLNRRIVFAVLDNVVGEYITIPATIIPDTPIKSAEERTVESERNKQFLALRMFRGATRATEQEAEFYLEEHEYNVPKAIEAFDADVQWEKDQTTKSKGAILAKRK